MSVVLVREEPESGTYEPRKAAPGALGVMPGFETALSGPGAKGERRRPLFFDLPLLWRNRSETEEASGDKGKTRVRGEGPSGRFHHRQVVLHYRGSCHNTDKYLCEIRSELASCHPTDLSQGPLF
jgi:hypothetical protein